MMYSVTTDQIREAFLSKIKDYKQILLTDHDIRELQNDWLRATIGNPRVRNMFSSFSVTGEFEIVEFEFRNSVDEFYDYHLALDLFATGMVIAWLNTYVNTTDSLAQMFGGKEENFYSQSSHLAEARNLLNSNKVSFEQLIGDHGTYFNSYVRGD